MHIMGENLHVAIYSTNFYHHGDILVGSTPLQVGCYIPWWYPIQRKLIFGTGAANILLYELFHNSEIYNNNGNIAK